MRFLGVSIAAGVCLLAVSSANAGERLTDGELDRVVAGLELSTASIEDLFSTLTIANMPILRIAATELAAGITSETINQNEDINDASDVASSPVGPVVSQLSAFGKTSGFTLTVNGQPIPDS
jgi:hypothetical protein